MPIISKETDMEDYVTYEQAVKLKELGFDWECNHWYHQLEPNKILESVDYSNHNRFERPYSAPTLAQAQKWLREVKGILILIQHNKNFYWAISTNDSDDEVVAIYDYETYEKALLGAINKALELLK